ncbi:DMT family transporter [Thioclava sp. GXIMD4215]|uniref:DMT family transporter n=1 Tax=Thioclava sp. GXIMD4215 TaxID=3131928 RepID=UPI0032561554
MTTLRDQNQEGAAPAPSSVAAGGGAGSARAGRVAPRDGLPQTAPHTPKTYTADGETGRPRNGFGMICVLCAFACFTLMDACAKGLSQHYDPVQIVWLRYLTNTALLLLVFAPRLGRLLPARQPRLQVLRGAMQLTTVLLFFTAIQSIGLAEATALADLNPVLVTLGAALFLRERLGPRRLMGIGFAFCGAMIIIRPGPGVLDWAALYALGTAICFAGGMLITRMIQRDGLITSLIWGALVGLIGSSLALPFVWRPIAAETLWPILGLGLSGAIGQGFLVKGYSIAEASSLAPFGYTGLIFATLWGILFFGQYPDGWTVVGALVIVGAGLYVWWRENRI